MLCALHTVILAGAYPDKELDGITSNKEMCNTFVCFSSLCISHVLLTAPKSTPVQTSYQITNLCV